MPKYLKAFKRDQALVEINKNTIHGQLLQNSERCQDIKIMVAGWKRVDRLNLRISTPGGVPLSPYRYKRGTNESTSKKQVFSMYLGYGLSKPAGM